MLNSLPIDHLRISAFGVIDLNGSRAINFLDDIWSFPFREKFSYENFSLNGKDHISSRKFIALEPLRSITPKALIRRWSMGKELSITSQVHLLMLKLTLFQQLHRR